MCDPERFKKIHAAATALLRLRNAAKALAVNKLEPYSVQDWLRWATATGIVPLGSFALIDEALGLPPGTILRLRAGDLDPLECEARPMALLGRALDLELPAFLRLLAPVVPPTPETESRLALIREAWARAMEDDPLPTE